MAFPYAALHVPRAAGIEPTVFLRGIADVLRRRDCVGGGAPKKSDLHGAVAGDTLLVKVETSIQPDAGGRVVFKVAPRPGRRGLGKDRAVAILSDVVLRALPLVEAKHVEWLDPSVALSPEEFQAAQSYISPRRARQTSSAVLPVTEESVDEIERNLARIIQEQRALFEAHYVEPTIVATAPRMPPAETPRLEIDAVLAPHRREYEEDTEAAGIAADVPPQEKAETSLTRAGIRKLVDKVRMTRFRRPVHIVILSCTAAIMHHAGVFEPVLRGLGQ